MESLYVFLVLGVVVGLSALYTRLRKKVSSRYVDQKLQTMDDKTYHVVSPVQLPDVEEKIDHVIVSIYGIFLIKRENYNASIYGDATDKEWIFQVKKKKKPFANPLLLNENNKQALATYLEIDPKHVIPIVAFSNSSIIAIDKKLLKSNAVVNYDQLVPAIQAYKTPRLSKEKVAEFTDKLQKQNS